MAERIVSFHGLPIRIEIEPGELKSGVDRDGLAWSHRYQFPYGEILGTEGQDFDPVDVYLGPNEASDQVFVVHQVDKDDKYDEDKSFIGFDSADQVQEAYAKHGPSWGFSSLDAMSFENFVHGYLASNRKVGQSQPHKENAMKNSIEICPECGGEMREIDRSPELVHSQCNACGKELYGPTSQNKNAEPQCAVHDLGLDGGICTCDEIARAKEKKNLKEGDTCWACGGQLTELNEVDDDGDPLLQCTKCGMKGARKPEKKNASLTPEDFTEGRVKCSVCGEKAIGTLGESGPAVCDQHAEKENATSSCPDCNGEMKHMGKVCNTNRLVCNACGHNSYASDEEMKSSFDPASLCSDCAHKAESHTEFGCAERGCDCSKVKKDFEKDNVGFEESEHPRKSGKFTEKGGGEGKKGRKYPGPTAAEESGEKKPHDPELSVKQPSIDDEVKMLHKGIEQHLGVKASNIKDISEMEDGTYTIETNDGKDVSGVKRRDINKAFRAGGGKGVWNSGGVCGDCGHDYAEHKPVIDPLGKKVEGVNCAWGLFDISKKKEACKCKGWKRRDEKVVIAEECGKKAVEFRNTDEKACPKCNKPMSRVEDGGDRYHFWCDACKTSLKNASPLPLSGQLLKSKDSSEPGWEVVLAKVSGASPFATWNREKKTGECQSGHYFVDQTSAEKDFEARNSNEDAAYAFDMHYASCKTCAAKDAFTDAGLCPKGKKLFKAMGRKEKKNANWEPGGKFTHDPCPKCKAQDAFYVGRTDDKTVKVECSKCGEVYPIALEKKNASCPYCGDTGIDPKTMKECPDCKGKKVVKNSSDLCSCDHPEDSHTEGKCCTSPGCDCSVFFPKNPEKTNADKSKEFEKEVATGDVEKKNISDALAAQIWEEGSTGDRAGWAEDSGCPPGMQHKTWSELTPDNKYGLRRYFEELGNRAHTPIVSEKQAGFFGAELGKLRAGKARETDMPEAELVRHLKEWGGNALKNDESGKCEICGDPIAAGVSDKYCAKCLSFGIGDTSTANALCPCGCGMEADECSCVKPNAAAFIMPEEKESDGEKRYGSEKVNAGEKYVISTGNAQVVLGIAGKVDEEFDVKESVLRLPVGRYRVMAYEADTEHSGPWGSFSNLTVEKIA